MTYLSTEAFSSPAEAGLLIFSFYVLFLGWEVRKLQSETQKHLLVLWLHFELDLSLCPV